MRRILFRSGTALVLALAIVAGAWFERDRLLAKYYVHRLAAAGSKDRKKWAVRAADLGASVVAEMVSHLKKDNPEVCAILKEAMAICVDRWGMENSKTALLIRLLAVEFQELSVSGQLSVLEMETGWLKAARQDLPPNILEATAKLLSEARGVANSAIRARALTLAAYFVQKSTNHEHLESCREVVRTCLGDENSQNRLNAIRLGQHRLVRMQSELVPLLRDPAVEIRRLAIRVLGPSQEGIADEDLLYCLHDSDLEIRSLSETALRSRGLSDIHLKLGRLITDGSAAKRLEVLDHLTHSADLEPGIWLRRLSHDQNAAVRAAAIRVATELTQVDLGDRMNQMVQNDPSYTIQQLARFYLSCQKAGANASGPNR